MRYQLYEQNIHVCIFIQAEMIIIFSFIKSVLLLKERKKRTTYWGYIDVYFCLMILLYQNLRKRPAKSDINGLNG